MTAFQGGWAGGIGVLFGCFGKKIDDPGLPGGLIIYHSPKRTPMAGGLSREACCTRSWTTGSKRQESWGLGGGVWGGFPPPNELREGPFHGIAGLMIGVMLLQALQYVAINS